MPKGGKKGRSSRHQIEFRKTDHGKSLSRAQAQIAFRARPIDLPNTLPHQRDLFDNLVSFEDYRSDRQRWSWKVICKCNDYFELANKSLSEILRTTVSTSNEESISSFNRLTVLVSNRIKDDIKQFNQVVKHWNLYQEVCIEDLISTQVHCFSLCFISKNYENSQKIDPFLEKIETAESYFSQCQVALDDLFLWEFSQIAFVARTKNKLHELLSQTGSFFSGHYINQLDALSAHAEGWESSSLERLRLYEGICVLLSETWSEIFNACDGKIDGLGKILDEAVIPQFTSEYNSIQSRVDELLERNDGFYQVSSDIHSLEIMVKRRLEAAATTVQTQWRDYAARAEELKVEAKLASLNAAATRIQARWRGRLARTNLLRVPRLRAGPVRLTRPNPRATKPPRQKTTGKRAIPYDVFPKQPISTHESKNLPEVHWGDEFDVFWEISARRYVGGKQTKEAINDSIRRLSAAKVTNRSILPEVVRGEIPKAATVYHRTIPHSFTVFFYPNGRQTAGSVQRLVVFGIGRHKTRSSKSYRMNFWSNGGLRIRRNNVSLI
ncbi:MAG: hypothetical protein AAF355_01950 [Myxococcota bacterium]